MESLVFEQYDVLVMTNIDSLLFFIIIFVLHKLLNDLKNVFLTAYPYSSYLS